MKIEIPYEIKMDTVKTNFNDMLRRGHFSICDFKERCELLEVHIPSDVKKLLEPLHCINFGDMNPKLRTYILELIIKVYNQEPAMYLGIDGEVVGGSVGFDLSEKQDKVGFKMINPLTSETKKLEHLSE